MATSPIRRLYKRAINLSAAFVLAASGLSILGSTPAAAWGWRTINSVNAPSSVTAGSNFNVNVNVTTYGSSNDNDWKSTGYRLGRGNQSSPAWSSSWTCVNAPNYNQDGTYNYTLSNIVAPTTVASNYWIQVVAYSNNGCSQGASNSEYDSFSVVAPPDTTKPVITLTGANPVTIEAGNPYVELGATWTDNKDGGPFAVTVIDSSAVNTSVVGNYTVVYTATDAAGNTQTANRSVNVIDTTAPLITLNGANPMAVEAGDTYVEQNAVWTDLVDGTGTVTNITGTVNTLIPGTYVVTYSYTDTAGNTTTADRQVNVVDTTAPVVTLNGDSNVTIEAGDAYDELGATWTDIVDGTNTNVVITGDVDVMVPGNYELTYSYTDAAGNTGSATRTVTVEDTTAPVITITGGNISLVQGSFYGELGATWTDIVDGSGNVTNISGVVNMLLPGVYTVTYSVTDNASNTATSTRTVTVTQLPPAPVNPVSNTPQSNGQILATSTVADDQGEDVLGEQTPKNEDDQDVAGTSDDQTDDEDQTGDIFGLAWYWWLAILAALAALGWLIAAYLRRRGEQEA